MNIIIGRKPVLEALNSEEEIEQVYILFGQQGNIINAIRVAAKKRGIKCNQIPLERFKTYTPDLPDRQACKNSQGVIALKQDFKFSTLDEILRKALSFGEGLGEALILILDEIQDPHNVGAILRSAECSGVNGVILTKHNSATITSTVVKVSAGATEHLKICQVNNLSQTIDELKEKGFWIVGSSLENAKNYNEVDYKIPIALIVGNEEKGIRKLTASKCDFLIKIPMSGKIQSLNVSVATGILLFEILRQRQLN
ncbi:MAG: 23S rRNA (guanosine(2251)-2'-O)-methyltransferase RlmB [Ignavibacteriota bacterium]|jgi:23S rRNA (guanosine2251-2'-O)-methyltransferase|nr:23S rRNA (guanosine(2251)-2'-O)-methyltransferase RlmB [Ignavibacteriales bacterium]MBL1121840.1 23S rRNA (guanosine(2251)-2'-O)-methyltransferase RlmB [Ignavibacteriota bacterium]MCC7093813.1 23S rRNA (guanosine(2251)-2'-O)-methyltransferase RlmB [Ignavibacteriaceae bacterium]MEB2297605.1 23S rRNA (guanosine(2251)-2'-O)-methyltransferase RlmB [Ignavibacteria bacterium]MCZ7613807.1 23S rRNA (guanosine(2251)-2'-O)-methyltransferase RlmB [Ignavibacteriaceae bacterium]